jgi:hypothetical protein
MNSPAANAAALIRKEALISAGTNLAINAAIHGWLLAGKGPHVLTMDSIGSSEDTVFGSGVTLAVTLSLILNTITFFTFRKKATAQDLAPQARLSRPCFSFGLRQALRAASTMFGIAVVAGVLWQRIFGTLTVSTPVAALMAGLFAGVAAWYASSTTSHALLRGD